MKKVLILTSSHGYGHIATAKAVKTALEQNHSDKLVVEVADLLDDMHHHWNKFISRSYEKATKYAPVLYKILFEATDSARVANALAKFLFVFNKEEIGNYLASKKPDLILINFAGYVEIIGLTAEKYLPHVPLLCLVTDSISIHSGWTSKYMDYYLVANSDTAAVVKKLGAASSQIKTLGYPVSLDFSKPFDQKKFLADRNLNPELPTVLFLPITDKILRTKKIIRTVLAKNKVNLIVITGRNQDIFDKLSDFKTRHNFELVGWTDQMPDFIRASDLVITKAGGSTVMECIAAQKPVVIHHIIPGQEEGNAELVTTHHLGLVELDANHIASATHDVLSRLEYYRVNISRQATPEAAITIAEFIANIL